MKNEYSAAPLFIAMQLKHNRNMYTVYITIQANLLFHMIDIFSAKINAITVMMPLSRIEIALFIRPLLRMGMMTFVSTESKNTDTLYTECDLCSRNHTYDKNED